MEASDTDWAWIAGFFEGEGCISIRRHKQGGFSGIVSIGQRSCEPLEFVQEKAEERGIYCPLSQIHVRGAPHPIWKLDLSNYQGTMFLRRVFPHLKDSTRKRKAEIYQKMYSSYRRQGVRISQEQRILRENTWEEWLELKEFLAENP